MVDARKRRAESLNVQPVDSNSGPSIPSDKESDQGRETEGIYQCLHPCETITVIIFLLC